MVGCKTAALVSRQMTKIPSGSCWTVSCRSRLAASRTSGRESTPNPTDVTKNCWHRLLLVSCHEETQNEVDGFLPVVWCLPAHHVGRRSDEEARKERCWNTRTGQRGKNLLQWDSLILLYMYYMISSAKTMYKNWNYWLFIEMYNMTAPQNVKPKHLHCPLVVSCGDMISTSLSIKTQHEHDKIHFSFDKQSDLWF